MAEIAHHQLKKEDTRDLVRKSDAVGWGVFFIWIGIAFLADVGWSVGLLGVGVIALGGQLARKYFGLPFDRFWLMIGFVFIVCGTWGLFGIEFGNARVRGSVLPILCIALGIVVVGSAFLRKPRH